MQEAHVCQFPQKKNVIAVDVGYGYTKAVSSNGDKVCFPSIISPARDLPLDKLSKSKIGHKVKIIKEDGREESYFVGELALQEGRSVSYTLDDVKHQHPVHDIVLFNAAALLDTENIDTLVVGLPVDYYSEQGESLTEHLTGLNATISVDDGQEKEIVFDNVLVYPQGAGALLTVPEIPDSGIVALVDVGYKTTDCVALKVENGRTEPVQSMCVSVEPGILRVQEQVMEEFFKLTGTHLHISYAEKLMRTGQIWFRGQELDMREKINEIKKSVSRSIVDEVMAAWGNHANFLRKVYFAGGGILELPDLKEMIPGAAVVEDVQFANALGFLKYGEG